MRALIPGLSSVVIHLTLAAVAYLAARQPHDEEVEEEWALRMRRVRIEALESVPGSSGSSGAADVGRLSRSFDEGAGGGAPSAGDDLPSAIAAVPRGTPRPASPSREPPHPRRTRSEPGELGMIGLLAGESMGRGLETWGPGAGLAGRREEPAPWGEAFGDGVGMGGLELSGAGLGSGSPATGVSVAAVGTLGHGGGGDGDGFGCGCGRGVLGGSHLTRVPVFRCGEPVAVDHPEKSGCALRVSGRLPPEAVQRVVRVSFGRFRLCYEEGLMARPTLAGRVTAKFVIGRDGSVLSSEDGGSDLPDTSVVACVIHAFGQLAFPAPEGGVVTVVYPLVLSPG